ncbi:hypothetical protein LOK49_Contig103G00006 [Camellia lanceoleosa]|nr:hypothetical protein LOK49_Contig103G00006 [Camellia lanceoleosa]
MMVAAAAISFFAGFIIIFVILHFFDFSQRSRRRHKAIGRPFRVIAPTQVNLIHESPRRGLEPIRVVVPTQENLIHESPRTGLEPIRAVVPTQENLIHESPRTGFDQSIIDLLPKFVYKASHRHWLGSDGGEVVKCTVCQSTIVEGNGVRLLNYFDEQEAPPPPKPAPAGWDASIATPFQPAVTSIGWGTLGNNP